METFEIKYLDERLGKEFQAPVYQTDGAAAVDLVACSVDGHPMTGEVKILPGEMVKVGSGVAIHLGDPNYVAITAPRSSTGVKLMVGLANTIGVIDSDYQGEIFLALVNNSRTNTVVIEPGQRLIQMMVVPVVRPLWKVVESFSETSGRGENGCGSTGHR